LARYRLMSAIVVNIAGGSRLDPGSIVTEGREVPVGFLPNGACEALDADAANKVWAQGPIAPTIDLFQGAPITFWKFASGANPLRMYQLQGLGSSLPPVLGGS
jgi:hypothetical protein